MTDLCALSAVEARRLIGCRKLSPVELLDACIQRIAAANPVVNAVCAEAFERARAEAEAAQEAAMKGEGLGPLHGLPVGIKDLNMTEGLRTTFGSPIYENNVPDRDEAMVAALRAAGAIVFCKTNTPEFGAGAHTVNPVYGATGNPFSPERTCGGSSGGSAVALACEMMPLASGSDSGGSLRIPAAFCGVASHRGTPGLVPSERRGLGFTTFSVLGPMARSVADLVLMNDVMVRFDRQDPLTAPGVPAALARPHHVDLSSLRVAVSADLGIARLDPRIRETFASRVDKIRPLFGECIDRDPPLGRVREVNWILRAMYYLSRHRTHYQEHKDKLGPNVISNYEAGLKLTAEEIAWAQAEQTAIYRRMQGFFEEVDLLICPVNPVPPFPLSQRYCDEINGEKLETYIDWMALAWGLTIPGCPVTALPSGLEPTGTPFGLQIVGPHYGDGFVLGAAQALEKIFAGDPELARPRPNLASLCRG